MGPYLGFAVEVFDGARRRTAGEFRRLRPAIRAARRAFESPRATLAVVRDVDSVLVYATDGVREWTSTVREIDRIGGEIDASGVSGVEGGVRV